MASAELSAHGQRPGVLACSVAALVRELRPDWDLRVIADGPAAGAVQVVAANGRWLGLIVDGANTAAAARAVAEGARAVLPLDSPMDELDRALDALDYDGAPYLPGRMAALIAQGALRGSSPEPSAPAVRLTTREADVLRLVAHGLTNQEIADQLSVSVNTVRSHLQALSVKLNASTRAKMVANAWERLGASGMNPPIAS